MERKDAFKDWMVNINILAESTANIYIRQIELISEELINTGEIMENIYSINDSNEVNEVLNIFLSNSERKKKNDSGNNQKSSALSKYSEYLLYLAKKEKIKYDLYVDEIDNEINKIEYNLDKIENTERLTIINSRIGQSEYRQGLLKRYKKCQLCEINIQELLIASHIKPWSESTKLEQLDLNNGLLLCCLHDKLFDLGFISFNEYGEIVVSNSINNTLYNDLNILSGKRININDKTKEYLIWHKVHKFRE
jgi:hypothetical protein